jgi:hypothetical protein
MVDPVSEGTQRKQSKQRSTEKNLDRKERTREEIREGE